MFIPLKKQDEFGVRAGTVPAGMRHSNRTYGRRLAELEAGDEPQMRFEQWRK
jgi:hypothetical protein